MALSDAEETKLRAIISAYDNGKKTTDLPQADASDDQLTAAVVDKSGESKQVKLFSIVKQLSTRECGRTWNETLSTPIASAPYGNIDMLRDLPNILGLGCYTVTDDGKARKLDPTNHYKYQDGSPALLDGTHGQYMWGTRGFYFASWKEGNNTHLAVSDEPFKNQDSIYIPAFYYSAIGPSVLDRTDLKLCSIINEDPRYRGGTNATTWDGTPKSLCGKPVTNIGIHTLSDYARKRGQGWESSWYVAEAAKQILMYIIMGTRHLQAAVNLNKDANGLYQGGLGEGIISTSNGMTAAEWQTWSEYPTNGGLYQPHVHTSAGVELGDGMGETSYNVLNLDGSVFKTVKVPVFFGMKHPWGYLWRGVRGLINDVGNEKSICYVSPSLYAGQSNTSVAGMLAAAELSRTQQYIKTLSYERLCMAPTEVGGTSATYYGDYFWTNWNAPSIGLRSRLAGSAANNGADAGPGAFNANNTVTNASTTTSGSLYFETLSTKRKTLPIGKR